MSNFSISHSSCKYKYICNCSAFLQANYILKYMLGNVSENRQDDLVKDVKDAYNRIQLPIVEQVICDNSGFIIAEL